MTTDTEFLYVDHMVRDFPYLGKIAGRLNLPEQAAASDAIDVVKAQLQKVTLSPTLHICKPGEMHKKFGAHGMTLTVPDKNDVTKWHVAVELQGPNQRLIVGSLLTAYGHYIEDIASGKGYLRGPIAIRQTSFDHALLALELAWNRRRRITPQMQKANPEHLRKAADLLVGVVNGLWLALACGIDPVHARIQLLIACLQPDRQVHPYASSLVLKEMEAFCEVFLNRSHYDHEVGEAGWGSEKEMCLNFDAATTRFFKSLT